MANSVQQPQTDLSKKDKCFFAPVFRTLLQFSASISLMTVLVTPALAGSPDVVISQIYGGGGNAGTTYKNDFIELHNTSASAVSLGGWSVQYAAATGTSWQVTNLSNVTLQPGQYFLIQEAAGTGGTTSLPTPNVTGSIALSSTSGKVALVTSTVALSCGATCATNAAVRDFVGFGTANNYEGGAPVAALTNTTAALRNSNGCTDTNSNSTDFTTGAPTPRNTASAAVQCSTGPTNGACGSANNQFSSAAPTANLCASGTASAVTGSGPWSWSCSGLSGGTTASCSSFVAGGPFTIFHMNDVHARVTPHKWIINQHGNNLTSFEDVGGAAYLAGKLISLTTAKPTALVLDGGDISEGNPVGDMNGTSTGSYGNGGLTGFYSLLANKLKTIPGRSGRGIDALVVGNHDVRDASYLANMAQMHTDAGIPVISANVRDIATHQPHFPATTTLTVNGTKIGIIGYTTPSAVVGASLASSIEVVDCDWKGTVASGCHIADYVNDLRNNQHCEVVVLLTHDGHSDLVDPTAPVLADTTDAQVPEIAVTGHWHTWAETVWQPASLNYKTIFTESASFMKYIGELNVSGAGKYLSSAQHVLRNADIIPDPDVTSYVNNLITTYNNNSATQFNEVLGYTADDLMLDNAMKWWSADEYPWNGDNTAGQWITDAVQWKCGQLFGQCDLSIEAGGGVRADIPAGPVTWRQIYETFPWADDTYYRVNMTGQDIINFLNNTNLDAGFSSALDVAAFDGIITSIKFNGQPLDVNHVYTVGINNYMYAHPPAGYVWTDLNPLTSTALVRDGLAEFMRVVHPDAAHAYHVGGDRYHFNGEYSGAYRAVVTMMNDNDSKPSFEDAFIRILSANPETLARRGTKQVPDNLVNADGSVNPGNRLAEQELYRSFLGFKTGVLKPGDIIEVWGKSAFYGGNPEFVDQEGIYADGVEFKILGHDDSLAKPAYFSSINRFLNDNYKNHYVQFIAKKTGANTVADQYSQTLKVWDATGYAAVTLPGNVGDNLLISGTLTMESFGFRLRSDKAVITSDPLPPVSNVNSQIAPLLASSSAGTITLTANASVNGTSYYLSPVADAQVASGHATTNYGSATNMYVQSSSTSTLGNERDWLKFDLSGLPSGLSVASATLQLWNWKSTGVSLPVEVRGSASDSWTETGITWSTQPALGAVLDTQILAAGNTNLWYNWAVGSFVQQEYAGDKQLSLLLKAATEGSADATAPSYGFDSREYGSNMPVLKVTLQSAATSVSNVRFYYRYSADNANWGAWTQISSVAAAPYNSGFSFPSGYGYYEFYSVATDNLGNAESTPAHAQSSTHFQAASGQTQSIDFAAINTAQVGAEIPLSASATSGLPVSFTSQTSSVCTISGNQVTTVSAGTCTLVAKQAGDANYLLPASATQSFNVLFGSDDNDVPLPFWVTAVLGLGLFRVAKRHLRR